MKDGVLYDIFLMEADAALQLLDNETAAVELHEKALQDLLGAAELLGNEEVIEQVGKLAASSKHHLPTAIADLRAIRSDIKAISGAGTSKKPSPVLSPAAEETVDHTTLVRRPRRRRSPKFDTAEHQTLLAFFQDEARENLDRITGVLLAASFDGPADDMLQEVMRRTHGLKGAAGTVDLPEIAELTHQYEEAFDKIRRELLPWHAHMRDELVQVADQLRIVIDAATGQYAAIGSEAEPLRALLSNLGKTSNPAPADDSGLVVIEESHESYAERRRPDRRVGDAPMLRVDPTRIDHLMNSVGELVFDRTRIDKRVHELEEELAFLTEGVQTLHKQRAEWARSTAPVQADQLGAALSNLEANLLDRLPRLDSTMKRLKRDSEELRKTEFALQEGLTSVRMQSVRSLFQRLTPQLRAIARQANRQVRLVTAGGETEFDKTVADRIIDPLIQLLRNAVAHGIETEAVRLEHGKTAEGRITVTARHEGNVVVLEVSDDGRGIDVPKLRQHFVDTGQWSESHAEHATEETIKNAIFDAGVSSRTTADELAGRGVGLSAVRETVTRLGGEVLVSSVKDRGTTFTLRLPLTTAVANAMLFKVGGHVFAIPSVCVVEPTPVPWNESQSEWPLVSLHALLELEMPSQISTCSVILIEYLGRHLALSCDKVIGDREIVIKSLGPLLTGVSLYAGGTISPSGKVQLILDPAALMKTAYPDLRRESAPDRVGERVIVVDDSRAIREAMRQMLERAGYEVLTAEDGTEAWDILVEEGCDQLVTDLEMPGGDGFALLDRLRADTRYRALPVLVISSQANEQNRERAAALGVIDFLRKPVDPEELVTALQAAASRHGTLER